MVYYYVHKCATYLWFNRHTDINDPVYIHTWTWDGVFPFSTFSALYILRTFLCFLSFPVSPSGMLEVKKFLYPSCSARRMLSMVGINFLLNISSLLVRLWRLTSDDSSGSALFATDDSFWSSSGSFGRWLSEINEFYKKNE